MIDERCDVEVLAAQRIAYPRIARDCFRIVISIEEDRLSLHALRERAQFGRRVAFEQREVAAVGVEVGAQFR